MSALFDHALEPEAPSMGLVVLQADETVECDMRAMLPAGARLYVTRTPSALEVSSESLAAMEATLPAAAALLPVGARLDVLGYACTSGSAEIGSARVGALLREGAGRPSASTTNPLDAVVAACAALGLRRLALLSPYVAEVSAKLRDALAQSGVETPLVGTFDISEEARVARIDRTSILAAAEALVAGGDSGGGGGRIDGLLISCTNLRTLEVIDALEARCDLPVISSNQALAWRMASLAGLSPGASGPGRLLRAER